MSPFSAKLKNILIYVLMLQILNLSIYNSDFYSFVFSERAQLSEDNPIDSFAELILEGFAGMDNVFPEYENQNSKQSPFLKQNLTLKLIALDFFPKIELMDFTPFSLKVKYPHINENYSFLFVDEIVHPPSC